MKILAIGDFHGIFPKKLKNIAKKVDLILCTGDLGGSEKLLKLIFKHFSGKWWKKVGVEKAKKYIMEDYNSGKRIINELASLNKEVYIISGNWDFISKSTLERTAGLNLTMYPKLIKKHKKLHYWKRGLKKVRGLDILAFGGEITAGEYVNKKSFYKDNPKKLAKHTKANQKHTNQIMKYSKKNLDILFAHYPAYGFFDKVKFKGENPMNGKHVGFMGYTEYIKKYKPKIFICGHMHEYQGKTELGNTIIIATGAAKEGKGAMIEFDEKKGKVKKVELIR